VNTFADRIERNLDLALSISDVPKQLQEAMRYSTLAAGKRLRAKLVYASGTAVNAPLAKLDSVAIALECIHSYSLIHDDLPAMDDDVLRRGKATNHIAFDEATAILAGDALQTFAFEIINSESSSLNDQQARIISTTLAIAAGQRGMVGGQMLDILATNQTLTQDQLANIHHRKTGALIRAAVLCGAYCADEVSDASISSLQSYADKLGLAYQVIDDILDVESSTEVLGKTTGTDNATGKSTYPAIIGLAESKALAQTLYHEAIESIASIGDNKRQLVELADLLVNRSY
jgi:farnesyl diphosphate synthase